MAKKRGETSSSDKLALKKALQKKVDYLLKKPNLDAINAYNLIKDFFKAYTGNEIEFTREELLEELDKVYLDPELKQRLEDIILNLGKVEFAPIEYNRNDVADMLQEFSSAIDIIMQASSVKISFWDKFFKTFNKKSKKDPEPVVSTELSAIDKFVQEADVEMKVESVPISQPEPTSEEFAPPAPVDLQAPPSEPEHSQYEVPSAPLEESLPEFGAPESELPMTFEESSPKPEPGSPGEEPGQPEPKVELSDLGEGDSEPEPKLPADYFGPEFEEPAFNSSIEEDEILGGPDFETILESFYSNVQNGRIDAARLEYEELKHTYEWMEENEKHEHYDKLAKAHETITSSLDVSPS